MAETYLVNSMVVIPQTAGILQVWVVVVLVFADFCDILSPAIKRRARVRTMEVDRVWVLGIVDEPHDGLSTSGNDERRSRRHAVVANKLCWFQVGVYLFGERFDLNLVIQDVISRYGVRKGPGWVRFSATTRLSAEMV